MNCYQEPCSPGKSCCSCGGRPGYRPWDHSSCGVSPVNPAVPQPSPREVLFSPASSAGNAAGVPQYAEPHAGGVASGIRQPAKEGMPADLSRFPIAMGYVPVQQWQQPYSMEEGFVRGTIFPELDLPFKMGRCI